MFGSVKIVTKTIGGAHFANGARNFAVGQSVTDFTKTGKVMKDIEGKTINFDSVFKGKKVVLFGLPGAYTPVCSSKHVPAYIKQSDELKKAGIDQVYCVTPNDRFVTKAWGESLGAEGKVGFFPDWDGSFNKFLGLDMDLSAADLGARSKRYAVLVDNGKVVWESVEKSPGEFSVSGPEEVLKFLKK